MATFAPSGAVAGTGVVVHLFAEPTGRTNVARLAIHCGTVKQLTGLRHMVSRLAQCTPELGSLRYVRTGVTGFACGNRDRTVAHRQG